MMTPAAHDAHAGVFFLPMHDATAKSDRVTCTRRNPIDTPDWNENEQQQDPLGLSLPLLIPFFFVGWVIDVVAPLLD